MTQAEAICLPPFAYVPGHTARHDEATFAPFHDSVTAGMCPDQLAQTLAWRAAWVFLEAGFFWEAHEVLEPVWMTLPDGSVEKRFVQGIIQLANAELKRRMGKPNAVRRLCDISRDLFAGISEDQHIMGFSAQRPLDRLARLQATLND